MIISKLENNICQVICGNKKGTGFLISNSLVVTVFHVVKKYEKESIKLNFRGKNIDAQLHESIDEEYKKIDIAVLKLTEKINFYKNIIFLDIDLLPKTLWLSRGYPSVTGSIGTNLIDDNNYVNQQLKKLKNDKIDIVLNMSQTFDSYKGLSGSPLVIDNNIVGIINTELEENGVAKELYALSFKYFKALIEKLRKDEQKENEITDILKNGKSIELVKVELDDNRTLYVGKYPVTFEEYDLFCEDMNLKNPDCYFYPEKRKEYPVVNISWDNVIMYCAWLNKKATSFEYSLPTSREWDSIAMKNLIEKDKLDEYIWHQLNTTTIQMVGTKKSGLLGIHDMYGNIWEWCSDSYDDEYRIIKGNSYNRLFKELDIEEDYFLQNNSKSELGFRIIAKKIVD